MLFNSYIFIYIFLPVVLTVFFLIGKKSKYLGAFWLLSASLFFYGWWNPEFVVLLLVSILFNYGIGRLISNTRNDMSERRATWLLRTGITVDLGILAYYKYTNFVVHNLDIALNMQAGIESIVLPLGISFFTFTQIAFLIDVHRGEVKEPSPLHYGLFITYFPHLIAGPILHHKEMMPQFASSTTYKMRWGNISAGLTMFTLGLIKKIVFADGIAPYANSAFTTASAGGRLTFLEAWAGALSYTFQLYFDFSGYSDMAIGLSFLFGIRLPLNFNSPYKSLNIIDFWRRWHITLSRFLRDYLYISLGGNRKGKMRRHLNLLLTMVLGGLWHGAGWTYIIWGCLHGLYLIINHGWHQIRAALGQNLTRSTIHGQLAAMATTFIAVVIGWVFFRAPDIDTALRILDGMFGFNGIVLPEELMPTYLVNFLHLHGITVGELTAFKHTPGGFTALISWISLLWILVWFAPNSQEIMGSARPGLGEAAKNSTVQWQPTTAWMMATSVGLLYALSQMGTISDFLYFQF